MESLGDRAGSGESLGGNQATSETEATLWICDRTAEEEDCSALITDVVRVINSPASGHEKKNMQFCLIACFKRPKTQNDRCGVRISAKESTATPKARRTSLKS